MFTVLEECRNQGLGLIAMHGGYYDTPQGGFCVLMQLQQTVCAWDKDPTMIDCPVQHCS